MDWEERDDVKDERAQGREGTNEGGVSPLLSLSYHVIYPSQSKMDIPHRNQISKASPSPTKRREKAAP